LNKEALPDKALKDRQLCPRQNACDEIAMYMGSLLKTTIPSRRNSSQGSYVHIAPNQASKTPC